jgi:hypothetical protein
VDAGGGRGAGVLAGGRCGGFGGDDAEGLDMFVRDGSDSRLEVFSYHVC